MLNPGLANRRAVPPPPWRPPGSSRREDGLHLPAAKDEFMDALRRHQRRPAQQPGRFRAVPAPAWFEYGEESGPWARSPSLPTWTSGQEDQEGGSSASSVSSGPISGSSGGHEPCPPHGLWRERPPQVSAHPRQPRKRDPRLEQLRDKIRAQAQWQSSCASLGPSLPFSTSRFSKAPTPALQRKTRKVAGTLAAPAHPVPWENKRIKNSSYKSEKVSRPPIPGRAAKSKDSELVGVYAWRKGQALVRSLLGPPPARPRLQNKSPSRDPAPTTDLGAECKATAAQGLPGPTWTSRPTAAHSDQLASYEPPATMHTAMAILQDLRQQIQAGLEMAQHPRGSWEPKPQSPGVRRQESPQSAQPPQGSSPKSAWTVLTEGSRSSLGRARSFHTQKPWSSAAERKPNLQRAWTAQARDLSYPRPEGPTEGSGLLPQRPWSALAGQPYSQRSRAAAGQDFSQRPASPPEKLRSSRQPQSTLSPWAPWEDQRGSVPRLWSPPGGLRLSPQSSWSGTVVPKVGSPPLRAQQAWQRPAQQQDAPRPRPQQALQQPHGGSESLRDFMRRKAHARRQQALEQKALAAHTLELRNQRLQEVYRKQREAVRGKVVPLVSQTNPGIVTFVPSSAQARGLESPGNPDVPVLEWSKVTSGKVLSDQEAPGSFCLCLNRAWNRAETLNSRVCPDSVSDAPLLLPAGASWGPSKIQDLPPGLCICVEPSEAEALSRSGPLHFQYKQARLQALETMANVLRQRIDILTAKLCRPQSLDAVGSLALDAPTSGPSTEPATPTLSSSAFPEDLVPCGGRGAPQDTVDGQPRSLLPASCFSDAEMLPWRSRWELQSLSTPAYLQSQAKAALDKEEDDWELEKRPRRASAPLQALSAYTQRTPATMNPASSSLWLEEVPSSRAAGLGRPWTGRSCGQQGPHPEDLPSGQLLANLQLKSQSFLQSLKHDQWKQEKALSLLRQRAEHEVWETQMALDGLLFKHQLEVRRLALRLQPPSLPLPVPLSPSSAQSEKKRIQRDVPEAVHALGHRLLLEPASLSSQELMERHSAQASPEKALNLEQLQLQGGSEPTLSPSPVTASSSRSLPPLGRDTAATSQSPEAPKSKAGEPAPAESGGVTVAMLEQSLHAEELQARHQAVLLRLRELALEEKACTELAWLEHQRGCLEAQGKKTAELSKRKQQVIRRLEQERREVQHLKNCHLTLHQDRKQFLQYQKAILEAQRSAVHLEQKLQAPPQSPSPRVKTNLKGSSVASQQPQRVLSPPTLPNHQAWTSPESSKVTSHYSEEEVTLSQTTWEADGQLQPLRPIGEGASEGSGQLVESGGQFPQACEEQPRVTLHTSSPDVAQLPGPDFPAIQAEGSPPAQLRPPEATDPPPGDAATKPSSSADGDTDPGSFHGQSREGPRSPPEAPVISPPPEAADVARSPQGDTQEVQSRQLGERRVQACQHEDPSSPCFWLEAAQPAACPGDALMAQGTSRDNSVTVKSPLEGHSRPGAKSKAGHRPTFPAAPLEERFCSHHCLRAPTPAATEEETMPVTQGPGSPQPQPAAPLGLSSPTSSVSSASSLTCSSLQEFQKVTATRVQLSDSSPSPSSLEAEVPAGADPSGSGGFFALDSQQEWGWPVSCGLHREHPLPGATGGDKGLVAEKRAEGRGSGSPCVSTEEAAVAEGPGPQDRFLRAGWPLLSPEAPPPRSGSELSEASSRIWDEDSGETPEELGRGFEPVSGSPWPTDASSTENSAEPGVACSSSDPGAAEEASGSSKSLTRGSHTEETKQAIPEAPTPCASDLELSPRCPLGFPDADLSLPTERRVLQVLPEPGVPTSLQAPPEASPIPESQAPGLGGSGAPLVLEKAGPRDASGFLTEILSPVDEELSYGSGDLPSSACGDAYLPPPPPSPGAESEEGGTIASPDFPSPPEEAPLGEDTNSATPDLSSLSQEALEEALTMVPQESGLCLEPSGQDSSLSGKLSTSSSTAGNQAACSRWSEPRDWPASPLREDIGSTSGSVPRPPAKSPTAFQMACTRGEGLTRPLVASPQREPRLTDTQSSTQWEPQLSAWDSGLYAGSALDRALGNLGRSKKGVQYFQGAEGQQGSGNTLDTGASVSPLCWPAAPPLDPTLLEASGQAGSSWHAGEDGERSLSHQAQDQPALQGSLGRDRDTGPASGPCAEVQGSEGARAVDLVSSQLSRRILCVSLAALSGVTPQDRV
ncbi:coiled-coil domain-containing protein 187 [Thomomys bottae]